MKDHLFDIERSIATNKIKFVTSKDKRSFLLSFLISSLALFVFGSFLSIPPLEKLLQKDIINTETYGFIFLLLIGLFILSIAIEQTYSCLRLKKIKSHSISSMDIIPSLYLALDKAGYEFVKCKENEIMARKKIRHTSEVLLFFGFKRDNTLYYAIYKEARIPELLTTFIKPLSVHEFEEFYEYATKIITQQKK